MTAIRVIIASPVRIRISHLLQLLVSFHQSGLSAYNISGKLPSDWLVYVQYQHSFSSDYMPECDDCKGPKAMLP